MSETDNSEPSALPDEFAKYKTDFFHIRGVEVYNRQAVDAPRGQVWNTVEIMNFGSTHIRAIDRLGMACDIPPYMGKLDELVDKFEEPMILLVKEIGHCTKVRFNSDGRLHETPELLRLFKDNRRCGVTYARIAYAKIPVSQLERSGRVYISAFDLYLVHENYFHEASTHPLAERQFEWMQKTETDALASSKNCALTFRLVDSTRRVGLRYISLEGCVYELFPEIGDPVSPDGLYITRNGRCTEEKKRYAIAQTDYYTVAEMDELPYIFDTYKEAFEYDPVRSSKLQLELINKEIEARKQVLENRKIDFEEESLKRKSKMEEDKLTTDAVGNIGKIVDTFFKTLSFAFNAMITYLKLKAA